MKKILPIALLVGILMVASAWSISWFAQAKSIRHGIESAMRNLDPNLGSMKAASVTISGFPTTMIVTIANPSITLHLQQALAKAHKHSMAAAGNSAGVLTTPTYPVSTLNYALAGNITLTLNALSDALSVEYRGAHTVQLAEAASTLSLATEYNDANRCDVKLQRGFSALLRELWDMKKFMDAATALGHLHELYCTLPGGITTDTDTQQIVSSLGGGQLIMKNNPVQGTHHTSLFIQVKEYEIFPTGDEAMNRLRRAMTPVGESFAPLSLSLYGKQSLSADLVLELPQDMKAMGDQPFRIEVKQFTFASDASATEGTALFASRPQGTQQQGEAAMRFTSSFLPRQADIARTSMGQFLREIRRNEQFAADMVNVDSAKLEAAVFDALPNVTTLGVITQNIALKYSLEKEKRTGAVDIASLEISTRDYGISGNGNASMAEGQMLPAVQASLTCKNCIAMIDVIAGYLLRVEAAAVVLSPENAGKIALLPQEVAGAKQLLQAVGTPSGTADLQFSIESKDGALNINGKTLPELMMLVQQAFASATPQAR